MREWLDVMADKIGGLLVMDGFDDCIIGVATRNNECFVVYDRHKVIKKLMADGMTEDEAVEFHYYNQVDAYYEKQTVAFLDTPPDDALQE